AGVGGSTTKISKKSCDLLRRTIIHWPNQPPCCSSFERVARLRLPGLRATAQTNESLRRQGQSRDRDHQPHESDARCPEQSRYHGFATSGDKAVFCAGFARRNLKCI